MIHYPCVTLNLNSQYVINRFSSRNFPQEFELNTIFNKEWKSKILTKVGWIQITNKSLIN